MKKGKRYKSLYLPAVTIVFTVFILLVVIAISTYRNISRERQRTEDLLRREGLDIIRSIETGVGVFFPSSRPDLDRIQNWIEEIARDPGIAQICLFDEEGDPLACSPGLKPGEKIKNAKALEMLLKEKGGMTRYQQIGVGERILEVIMPFRPFPPEDLQALVRGLERKSGRQEDVLSSWARGKMISVGLHLKQFERAREEDIHHAILMGGILLLLGSGALYFIFIVQNYYLVDRTLAEMRTYTENVVESMADGLISIDNEGNIVTLNRRAGEILGVEEGRLRGKGFSMALGQESVKWFQNGRMTIRDREVEVPTPSGTKIPLGMSATPLKDETGREMGSVVLIRDLREIRDLQEKVRRSERLAALGRLAAGVAHEIRNPLSSIRGFAQFFAHRLRGQEKEQEYASIMVREVDRLNRVITELLDFARPKEIRREPQSLEDILEHTLRLLETELARKSVKLKKDYEENLPAIPADRDRLAQAFLNLLLNSLEAIEQEGTIGIHVGKETRNGRPNLTVSITDTGRGIPGEDLEKIFEPFFSTKRKGTGLGLAIVHQIVEAHKGEIRVRSREGQGTTFSIFLPMDE
jgi:two-component system sensor histidine kinase HydH